MISGLEHLLMCLLAICMSSLEKNVYSSSLLIFLIRLFVFLVLSFMSPLPFLDINPLPKYISFANIFFHSVGNFFVLLIVFFTVQKLFSLI